MLDPIHALLKDDFECLVSDDPRAIVNFRPRMLLLSQLPFDFWRATLPETSLVFVRHGFSNKNTGSRCMAGVDYGCVTSEWSRNDFLCQGAIPRRGFWVTGFIPMDGVMRRLSETGGRAHGAPTLLYAPTHNPLLSSANMLAPDWIGELCSTVRDLRVTIKPHPVTPRQNPEWMHCWREAAAALPQRVRLIEDTHSNLYDLLPEADVLLTDASSVMFYYLALDRPIVLVNNGRRTEDAHFYDADAPEWQWRDMGVEVNRGEDVIDAVRQSLANPREHAVQRATYRERVFGATLDGRAAERAAQRIRHVVSGAALDADASECDWNNLPAPRELIDRLRQLGADCERLQQRSRTLAFMEQSLAVRLALKATGHLDEHPRLRDALHKAVGAFLPRHLRHVSNEEHSGEGEWGHSSRAAENHGTARDSRDGPHNGCGEQRE